MIIGCVFAIVSTLCLIAILASLKEIHKLENVIAQQYDQLERFKSQRSLDQANIARCDALIKSLRARIFELKEENENKIA